VLVVWKLDRLGRSLKGLLGLMGEPHKRGVGFRSPRESLDAATPAGKLVFHVFASLAGFERDVIPTSSARGRWRGLGRRGPGGRRAAGSG
jgi:DNA invertase Pin-like site-specific DNA recombinase